MLSFCLLVLAAGELLARRLEPKAVSGLRNLPDAELGWIPEPGSYRAYSSEFDTTISVNSLNMNDREYADADLALRHRILALGDSHTFAVGASSSETWPKRLEGIAFSEVGAGAVMNGGVIGYSLGQYLVRYRLLRQKLRPTLVVVGFSMATDLYDLVPPDRGGFIYGGDAARRYFDLDSSGELVEKLHDGSAPIALQPAKPDAAQSLRSFLEQFALFRMAKRSNLAMVVAAYWRPGGKSLWPGLDTAIKVDRDADDMYRWRLAERILARLVSEAGADGAKVVIVNIPYLAQVYDEVWSSSFGRRGEMYDRDIAFRRLAEICGRIGAACVDTTGEFQRTARSRQRWLHWPIDGHPTPEGHELIARVVAGHLARQSLLRAAPSAGEPR